MFPDTFLRLLTMNYRNHNYSDGIKANSFFPMLCRKPYDVVIGTIQDLEKEHCTCVLKQNKDIVKVEFNESLLSIVETYHDLKVYCRFHGRYATSGIFVAEMISEHQLWN